jgi:hypothetical protein
MTKRSTSPSTISSNSVFKIDRGKRLEASGIFPRLPLEPADHQLASGLSPTSAALHCGDTSTHLIGGLTSMGSR